MTLREACKNPELDLVARLQLLEIIEMRSVKWKPNDDLSNYYKHKLHQIEVCDFKDSKQHCATLINYGINELINSMLQNISAR